MYLTALQIEGFRGSERGAPQRAPLAAEAHIVALPEGLPGCVFADAITLFSAALAASGGHGSAGLLDAAKLLGFAKQSTEIAGQGADAELQGLSSSAVASVVADGQRSITIEAQIALDPPLFGKMREHAARDPRMVTALGQDPAVRLKVGWLFSKDRTNATPSVLFLRVGDVSFELSGKERPIWVPDLLSDLGRRFVRSDPFEPVERLAERWHEALLSPDPAIRRGLARASAALMRPPFSLPPVGLLREPSGAAEIALGDELLRIRQLGRSAGDALRIVLDTFVKGPDVLVLDEPLSPTLLQWLSELLDADASPVEQVWHR